jgi:hypothetical protein
LTGSLTIRVAARIEAAVVVFDRDTAEGVANKKGHGS